MDDRCIHFRIAFVSLTRTQKKKIYYSLDQEQGKGRSYKKKNKLWKVVWNTSRPVIAAYLAKKLAEKVMPSKERERHKRI
jgi:hypothetical protein